MSPRKPAVLRGGDGQNLREYLIATAARLIDERGSAGLSVRDIAREVGSWATDAFEMRDAAARAQADEAD